MHMPLREVLNAGLDFPTILLNFGTTFDLFKKSGERKKFLWQIVLKIEVEERVGLR